MSFDKAFSKTMAHEGGYVNDPDDRGGETYRGVSRRFNPDWRGWPIVDAQKSKSSFPRSLKGNGELRVLVKSFYKVNYFDPFKGDDMPEELAIEMFDTAVNMGVDRGVEFLQEALNYLNRDGKLYPDMKVDGSYGSKTHASFHKYLKSDSAELLLKFLNVLQARQYMEILKRDSTQEKFIRGWFNRVEIYKS